MLSLPVINKHPHQVWIVRQRCKIVQSMIETSQKEGEASISSRAVKEFPLLFCTETNTHLTRASCLWKYLAEYLDDDGNVRNLGINFLIRRRTSKVHKQVLHKGHKSRGRQRAYFVNELHAELRDEFDRMRNLRVKFNLKNLRLLSLNILDCDFSTVFKGIY